MLVAMALVSLAIGGQGRQEPARLGQPPTDSWPTYNGDYSGRRFSTLSRIDASNVSSLGLAWVRRINTAAFGGGSIKSTPLQINGVLYFTMPDHVWAVDARTGRDIWHFEWTSKGGTHIGNRGVGVLGEWLFFETPDCHLVSLTLKDGKERWRQPICDLDQFYYGSVAPVIVKNHVMVGVSGDDLDRPGYVEARDPETGALQWRWYVVPQKKGDPGSDTWPNEAAMKHGGGMTWQPVTYDPDLNLVYVTTGNPQPVIAHKNRAGDNLFTGSIVALNADTGYMAWYFQSSPHDTHDWDSTQTPVLIDGEIEGRPRKLLAQAARNGHFFVLDRATGKALVSSEFVKTNWAKGYDAKGQPIPDPAKMPQIDGVLVSPNQAGAANWPPPSFSPDTGFLYVSAARAFSIYYLYDPSDNPQGWGGMDRGGWSEAMVQAIDYKTGAIRWTHRWEGNARSGLLSTAGNLVFAGGSSNDIVALNATTGQSIWHAGLGSSVTNGPITYMLDGMQYLVVGAGDSLFAFVK
ncbi:MAG: acido-empty-quinoprotein group A [Acidobacteria bacterium]|nr:acido-empty-quinoprotein group A [Acidobacteriota bacterium]MBI3261673.1 acido-empty-quinoprotein group A [Acidobacteriota bacterium]